MRVADKDVEIVTRDKRHRVALRRLELITAYLICDKLIVEFALTRPLLLVDLGQSVRCVCHSSDFRVVGVINLT